MRTHRTALFCALIFYFGAAMAQNDDLYKTGKKAYDSGDHISALKYLYAFRVKYEAELREKPGRLKLLDEVIEKSENSLLASVACAKKNYCGAPSAQQSAIGNRSRFEGVGHVAHPDR